MSPRPLPAGMRTLLDRPIAYHRGLVPLTGGALPALLLSQAIYWQLRTTSEDGWWWKTRHEWTEETGLSRSEQETARRALRQTTWWQEQRRGVPARMHYRVDLDALLAQLAGIQPAGWQAGGKRDGGNLTSNAGGMPPNTETTRDYADTTTAGSNQVDLKAVSLPSDLPLSSSQRLLVDAAFARLDDHELRAKAVMAYVVRVRAGGVEDYVAYACGLVNRAQQGLLTDRVAGREKRNQTPKTRGVENARATELHAKSHAARLARYRAARSER
jgi:hypothetical protein